VVLPVVTDRTTVGDGKLRESASYELGWPDGIRIEDSQLEVVVDRAGLAGLENSLRYLIHYPYGCLEQTLSGLIPLFKVKDLAAALKLKELQGPRLQTYIQLGIAKVLRHQQDDGHFSLWPDSRTYPHLTAYALYGLMEAKRSGLRVNAKAVERGMQALRDWANDQERKLGPGGESATMAMAAYVLAAGGKAEPGLAARLFDAVESERHRLSAILTSTSDSIIVTDSSHVVLSAIQAETIANRLSDGSGMKDNDKDSKEQA
jgi:uncharacterized protein YfaS (alpha-2-macroglobulin family)